MMYGYGSGYNCGGYGISSGWHFIIPVLLIGVIIYAVYKLINSNHNHFSNNDALNELNKKYINGELSEEEYLRKKQLLKK